MLTMLVKGRIAAGMGLAVLLLTSIGCSNPPRNQDTGFLDHHNRLEAKKGDNEHLHYEKAGVAWPAYENLIVESIRVQWHYTPEEDGDKSYLHHRMKKFESQLKEILSRDYKIRNQAEDNTLRLRTSVSIHEDAVTIESEVLDAQTLTRLSAFSDKEEVSHYWFGWIHREWNPVMDAMEDWGYRLRSSLRRYSKEYQR